MGLGFILGNASKDHQQKDFEQLDLFTDYTAVQQINAEEEAALAREKRVQETVIQLKNKFGKNAVMKGTNLEEGATSIDRNQQIGGHKA